MELDIYTIILVYFGVALILAKIMGALFEKYRLPGVLGEILTGVLMGASFVGMVFPQATWFYKDPDFHYTFTYMGHFGLLMLLFVSGLETDVDTLKHTGKVATVSTVMGVIVPLILGYIAGILMGFSSQTSLVLGALLTATSIGVTARTMMDLGVLSGPVGTASLSASVMDDFLGIICIIIAIGASSLYSIGLVVLNIGILIFVELYLGLKAIGWIMKLVERVKAAKAILAISFGIMFIFSAFSQWTVGVALEGAFFAGMIIGSTPQVRAIADDVRAISYGLFIPLFFIYIGSLLDLQVFTDKRAIILAVVILVLAIVGKVLGRAAGAKMGGFNWTQSLQMGIGSIPRMEVAIAAVTLAISKGALGDPSGDLAAMFLAATMIFVTVTTLITPPLVKWSFEREKKMKGEVSKG